MSPSISAQAKNYAKQAADLAKQNHTNLAIDCYQKAIAIEPKISPQVYKRLADALVKQGLPEKAIELLHEAIEHHPESHLVYSVLGNLLIKQGEVENGIKNLQQSLQLNPNPGLGIYIKLGNQLLKNNCLAEAGTVFQDFLAKYPQDPRAYSFLARLAMASQEWELAIERLDVGISLFADNIDFVLQKINALYGLDSFEQVKQVIEQAKSDFPHRFELDLAEAKFYQRNYNYKAAQQILDAAAVREPENLDIKLEKAHNYWLLGKNEDSKKILTEIRPQLKLDKSHISKKFTDPYVDILLKDNQIDDLKNFFESAHSAKILNRHIILNYCQLLISQSYYQEALQFIENIIQENCLSLDLYRTQALLLFEQEKIKNIQSFEKLDLTNQLEITEKGNLSSLLEKVKLQLQSYPNFEETSNNLIEIFAKLNQLSEQYPKTFLYTEISPLQAYRVAVQIIKHVKNKIPLSLIRLGDCEGNFLEYQETWQQFQEQDRQFAQKLCWGSVRIDEDEWQKLQDDYLSAIQNADILGIPDYYRFCRINNFKTRHFRGISTIIDILDRPTKAQESHQTLTSCHIHTQLEVWGLWTLILSQIKDCSVIACHEKISQFLLEKYGLIVTSFYKIPSEYKYSELFNYQDQQQQPHYPDHFRQIYSEITVKYPGEVFLVAAGFLGKIYCHIIKQRGGIAIDIGSVVDYWLNYNTRVWTKFPDSLYYTDIFQKIWEQDCQILSSIKVISKKEITK